MGLEFEVLQELSEEPAHRKGEPALQVVDEQDRLAMARGWPDLVGEREAHFDVLHGTQDALLPEFREELGGDDGSPPVTVALVRGHLNLQRGV